MEELGGGANGVVIRDKDFTFCLHKQQMFVCLCDARDDGLKGYVDRTLELHHHRRLWRVRKRESIVERRRNHGR